MSVIPRRSEQDWQKPWNEAAGQQAWIALWCDVRGRSHDEGLVLARQPGGMPIGAVGQNRGSEPGLLRSGLTEKTRRPGRSGACPVPGRLRRVAHALDHRGQPLTFSYEERIGAIPLTRSIGTASIPNLAMGAGQSGEGGPVWLPANAFQV